MIDDAKLVNTLLEQGVLDQATLKKGLEHTERSNGSLYETLIAHKLVTEDTMVNLVSGLLSVPAVNPDPAEIPIDVRDLVPASMARRNRVLPLRVHDDQLVLGMVDPTDILVMDEIATHTGIDIRPVLIGPATIDEAFEDLYGVSTDESSQLADDVLSSFDDFDVEGMMDEVMDDEQWGELFEDEDDSPSVEDSAVLSREMRDRPSTDVLAEEDVDAAVEEADRETAGEPKEIDEEDLIEIEIIEELGKPADVKQKASEYVSLDEWELDEAIAGPGDSEILSAESAEELFRSEPSGKHAALEDAEEEETGVVDDTGTSDVLEDTQSSKTTIGVSVDHLEDGTLGGETREGATEESEVEEHTGRTELGVATRADDDSPPEPKVRKPPENTDYGALGRAILKSSPSEATDEETNVTEGSNPEETNVQEVEDETNVQTADDDKTDIREVEDEPADDTDIRAERDDAAISKKEANHRPTDPEPALDARPTTDGKQQMDSEAIEALNHDSEGDEPVGEVGQTDIIDPAAVEEDRREEDAPVGSTGSTPEDTRPRLNSPQMRLPEGIDVEGLALALANLLIAKDILTLDEVFQLAKSLTPEEQEK